MKDVWLGFGLITIGAAVLGRILAKLDDLLLGLLGLTGFGMVIFGMYILGRAERNNMRG